MESNGTVPVYGTMETAHAQSLTAGSMQRFDPLDAAGQSVQRGWKEIEKEWLDAMSTPSSSEAEEEEEEEAMMSGTAAKRMVTGTKEAKEDICVAVASALEPVGCVDGDGEVMAQPCREEEQKTSQSLAALMKKKYVYNRKLYI